jgi:hypothetical protein
MKRPSLVQVRPPFNTAWTTLRGDPPSAAMSQMPLTPPRSDANATCCPSGEKTGRWSSALPDVNGRASDPSTRAIQM